MDDSTLAFRSPGAFVTPSGTSFSAHVTTTDDVAVRLVDAHGAVLARHPMIEVEPHRFEVVVPGVGHGARYFFELAGEPRPDPYARAMPDGVHGASMVWSKPYAFRYPRVERPHRDQVIYELHVGTFTPEGTFEAARARLGELVELGVTTVELMPVAAFAGRWGWGYDGVAHYAPHPTYGTPDDLARLVDTAHGLGLGVVLDVVYNHFGPDGNYLAAYDPAYFTTRFPTPWGSAPDFAYRPMRAFAVKNALHWLTCYRFDGLRLDAIHHIHDESDEHLLAEMAARVREVAPRAILIAEDRRNHPSHNVELGLDAVWVDDFHHQLHVTLTGERHGYYAGFEGSVATLARAIENLWLRSGKPRDPTRPLEEPTSAGLPAHAAIYFLQNHDHVGNRPRGDRLSMQLAPERYRAAAMLVLFLPTIPLLFMGEEWGAGTPFAYFTDHEPNLGSQVTAGRRAEFDFSGLGAPLDPQDPATFERSRLDRSERADPIHARTLELYRAMLHWRRSDEVMRSTGRRELTTTTHGDVLMVTRGAAPKRRVFIVNLGSEPCDLAQLPLGAGMKAVLWSEPPEQPTGLPPGTAVVLRDP